EITQKFGVTSPDTLNVLLMGCIKDEERGFPYALQVWRQMLRMGVTPDINTYNLLLRATRDCGIGDAAAAVLHALLQSAELEPLSLAAGGGHGGTGMPQLSDSGSNASLLDITADPPPSPPSPGIPKMPNFLDLSISTDSMLSLADARTPSDRLAMIGDLEGVLQKMSEDHVCPTIQTFTLLAEVVTPDKLSAAALLAIMDTHGIRPDLIFFNTLVLQRSKTLNLKSALELLPTMAQRGIAPNTHTFCNLARACLKKEDGLQLLEDMAVAGFHPNNNVYSTLIHAAIKRRDYEYLTNILRDMRNRSVAPNEVVIRQLEFAAQYPPSYDRYRRKNVFLEKIDGFRGYYNRWLEWMGAEESQHPWQKYRTKAHSDASTS
ncbi:hypothetical protein GDO78_020944, partial [Eleutherodactylus coqui]